MSDILLSSSMNLYECSASWAHDHISTLSLFLSSPDCSMVLAGTWKDPTALDGKFTSLPRFAF